MLNQKLGKYLIPWDFDLWVLPSAIFNSSVVKSLHYSGVSWFSPSVWHLLRCIFFGHPEYCCRTLYLYSRWGIFNNHSLLAYFLVKRLEMEDRILVVKLVSFTQSLLFFLTSLFCFNSPLIAFFPHCQACMLGLDVDSFCFNIFCFFFAIIYCLFQVHRRFRFLLLRLQFLVLCLLSTLVFCSCWPWVIF